MPQPPSSRPEHVRLPLLRPSLGSGWATQDCAETDREDTRLLEAFPAPVRSWVPFLGARVSLCPESAFPGPAP